MKRLIKHMKALTFIEFYKENIKNVGPAELEDNILACDKYFDFVSQTFKPEMIIELFEGFEIDNLEKFGVGYFYGLTGITFCKEEGEQMCRHYFIKSIITYELFMPTTLNDFISDCQRAGIDLELKEKFFNI